MAIAAPARRSDLQTAPTPQTEPSEPRKRPRDRPRPGGQGRSSATASVAAPPAPKRKTGTTKRRKASSGAKGATVAPKRKGGGGRGKGPDDSPIRKLSGRAAPAKAPRRKVAPRRRPAGVIPIAAGAAARSAVAVTQLPESGLIHRLTRGRAWIGVLGVLLVGIVALNVVTLSFAASAGKVDARNQELSRENSVMQSLNAKKYGQARLHGKAKHLGLATAMTVEPQVIGAKASDVATAAARLAAATGATAAASGEAEGTEAGASEGATEGSAAAGASGEEVGEYGYSPELEEIFARERAEAEGVAVSEGEVGTEEVAAETSYEEPVYEESVTE
jgi:hypothetical protein